jgi:hypothetical protein
MRKITSGNIYLHKLALWDDSPLPKAPGLRHPLKKSFSDRSIQEPIHIFHRSHSIFWQTDVNGHLCRSAHSETPIWHNVLSKTEMKNVLVRGCSGEIKHLNSLELAKKLMEEVRNMILNA